MKMRSKAIKKNRQQKSLESPSLKKAKSLIVSIPFNKLNLEKEINVDNSANIIDENQMNASYHKTNENTKSCHVSIDLNKTKNAVKVCLDFSEQGHQSTMGSPVLLNKAM